MIEGGVREGLSLEASQKLAIQTVIGGGLLARQQLEQGVLPDELRRRVTSPKGTTEVCTACVCVCLHRCYRL
jgi:pyrroline-5-carboxylate reductase